MACGSRPVTSAEARLTAELVIADSFTPSFVAGAAACRMPAVAVAGSLYRYAVPPVTGAAKPAELDGSVAMLPVPAGKETPDGVVPVPWKNGDAIGSVEVTVVPLSDTAELMIEFAPLALGSVLVVRDVEVVLPVPAGAAYVPSARRKLVVPPPVVSVTPFTVSPATDVVVLLAAIEVDPSVMGNPDPPPLPQAEPVPLRLPFVSACTHCVEPDMPVTSRAGKATLKPPLDPV